MRIRNIRIRRRRVIRESARISLRLPADLWTDIQARAMIENTSVSALIRSKIACFSQPISEQVHAEK